MTDQRDPLEDFDDAVSVPERSELERKDRVAEIIAGIREKLEGDK